MDVGFRRSLKESNNALMDHNQNSTQTEQNGPQTDDSDEATSSSMTEDVVDSVGVEQQQRGGETDESKYRERLSALFNDNMKKKIAIGIAQGCCYMHSKGITHRVMTIRLCLELSLAFIWVCTGQIGSVHALFIQDCTCLKSLEACVHCGL